MKSYQIIIFLLLLFIVGGNDGCNEEEEPKPDYIEVRVIAAGYVYEKDTLSGNAECSELCKNFQVRVKFIKAQGETFEEYKVTNENCFFQSKRESFKLYKEQPIEAYVESKNDIPGYKETGVYKILTWNQVYPAKDFGDIYYWDLFVQVLLEPE